MRNAVIIIIFIILKTFEILFFPASSSGNRMKTEPNLTPEWKSKKIFMIDDVQNCKDTLKKLEKRLKEGSAIRKSEDTKFFAQLKRMEFH